MSMQTAASRKHLGHPRVRFLKWPKFKLGRHLYEAIEAYSRALSLPYTIIFGLDQGAPGARESRYRNPDY